MKEFQSLREALRFRMTENPESYFDDYFFEEETKLACADLEKTIHFIQVECTDLELWWLGEVYEDIVEKSQSREFLMAVRERAKKVKDQKQKEDILQDSQDAAEFLLNE